ncbi:AIR synthase family protein [Niabella ginsengisoli]|uniref:AIR synthase family protein n=1 Tax=Niabella ginsengisoli TaxID=522298 RepID=A0ABS9SE21_9BACT|nr:AIR synthase family protein [Niabella ginsengisoli]MCH5596593.1 AIR synthase family protein [Niabella ginsengisoli]
MMLIDAIEMNKPGKLEANSLDQLVSNRCGSKRNEVTVGPAFGVDVSLINLPGNMMMAMASDPLSLIPSLGLQESAWLSVHLMTNDIATTGFAPMYAQMVLNLPSDFSKKDFLTYWDCIHKYCSDIGVAITGGHTGFVEGQNSTISGGGTLVAIAPKDEMLVSSMAQPGDVILVTKSCAISSTAILAMSFPETIKQYCGNEIYQSACASFYDTSSLKDAVVAAKGNANKQAVTAMHDVTEGGVLGAIYELCVASKTGAIIHNELLPVHEVQQKVCEVFTLDPRRCIGAGSMLICCKRQAVELIIGQLKNENIECAEVGILTEAKEGISIIENQKSELLEYQLQDPYWAAFSKACKEGWK